MISKAKNRKPGLHFMWTPFHVLTQKHAVENKSLKKIGVRQWCHLYLC